MKRIKILISAVVIALVCFMTIPCSVSAMPIPQYSSNDDSAGRKYTGYFIEDGVLKNTLIEIKLRRLRSYWNGMTWVPCNGKIEKSNLPNTVSEDDPDEMKHLAKFPSYVTIENKKVYFDPKEN